jgi:lysophospholipase L1-like esterase
MHLKKILFIVLFWGIIPCFSQDTEKWVEPSLDSISNAIINHDKNVLVNSHSLFSLLTKLYRIKHFNNEKAVIVHIGDSHIQADMMTSVIRNSFQTYFGNAGRGLLFPYQVAKSNAPIDIISSSKNIWKSSRIARIDTTITCGISAFGLETLAQNPEINIELRTVNGIKDSFDKISLFFESNTTDLQIESESNDVQNFCFETPQDYISTDLNKMTSSFKITFPTIENVKFYGALVEKNKANGIIYHSIGANGAKYSDFNKTTRFWKQLPKLNADCYIISLGTNEAQEPNFSNEAFLITVRTMVENIKKASPNAVILLSTPPVSYLNKLHPNPSLELITNALIQFCVENNIVYWDLFNASKGSEGALLWKSNQFLNTDLVHFTKKGYALQGDLFVAAFIRTWNEFLLKN